MIFGEDGKFYVVSPETYTSEPLPSEFMSTAEFVVGMGAMVSDVASLQLLNAAASSGEGQNDRTSAQPVELVELTQASACILMNLAAIRQVSEKAGDPPISFLDDTTCKCQKPTNTKNGKAAPSGPIIPKFNLKIEKDDLVIFGTDRKFYLLKKQIYSNEYTSLPRSLENTPKFMVQLGTQIADMPSLPTAGCACYLLNVASIRHGSTRAAVLIEKSSLEAQIEEEKYNKARLTAELKGTQVPRRASFKRISLDLEPSQVSPEILKYWSGELKKMRDENKNLQIRLNAKKRAAPRKMTQAELARQVQELIRREDVVDKKEKALKEREQKPIAKEAEKGLAEKETRDNESDDQT
ncbi:hypothetical protein [Archangium sp. Cb G35]|uniref:hypothetical protein n=1 Tax=Archangium sp. Cb G35 TaxID=1920190 RepID=UPI000A4EE1E4|nr:hypothetical protein [Archangium sp. Cb G35]